MCSILGHMFISGAVKMIFGPQWSAIEAAVIGQHKVLLHSDSPPPLTFLMLQKQTLEKKKTPKLQWLRASETALGDYFNTHVPNQPHPLEKLSKILNIFMW